MWEREWIVRELLEYFLEDAMKYVVEDEYEYVVELNKKEIEDTLDLDSGRYSGWGNAGSVTVDGTEYNIIENEEEAERIAIEIVKNDLEQNPEIFNIDFLKDYIYITDSDINDILIDEEYYIRERIEDEYRYEIDDEEDEDIDEVIDKKVEKELSELEEWLRNDPVGYFVDETWMYTVEDLLKQPFIKIDIGKAAKDAVAADGWAHFLSLYDGNYETTSGGIVIFRE
jgi:hypothetical protein